MRYLKYVFCCILFFSLLPFISGCGINSGSNGDADSSELGSEGTKKDYDLLVYNGDSNIAEQFKKMCDEYSNRTGVSVKCVTANADTGSMEQLRNYMSLTNQPNVFTVNNMQELKEWQQSGNILDFSNASEDTFKEMVNKIPENLRLSSNTVDSFGVPCTIEGYGYLVDPKMLSSLFGGDKYRSVLNDLKECTYDEFEGLVAALELFINGGGVYEINLNAHKYTLLPEKSGLSENLNGVFSFAAGDVKETGTYMLNIPLAATFKSAAEASIALDDKIDKLQNPLIKFVQALEVRTNSVAGKNSGLTRGIPLTDTLNNSPKQAIKNFVNGKSVFMLNGTWAYNDIAVYDSSIAKRLTFIPIKIPVESTDISAEDMTLKQLNHSITVSAPMYYAINAKSSEKERKLAQDFLTWIKTSELGEKYLIQEFGYVPYDIKDSNVIDNPLSRDMINYLTENHTLPGVYYGTPESWGDSYVGKYIVEQYYTKLSWSYSDYEKISEYAISKWKEIK